MHGVTFRVADSRVQTKLQLVLQTITRLVLQRLAIEIISNIIISVHKLYNSVGS